MAADSLSCASCHAPLRPADAADDLGVLNALDSAGTHRCPPAHARRAVSATATPPPRAKVQPLGEAPSSPVTFSVLDAHGTTVEGSLLLIPALRLARTIRGGRVVGP